MKNRLIDYDEVLMEQLQDEEFAIAYLNEALADEDRHVFLLAIKDVIEARGVAAVEIIKPLISQAIITK